MNETSNLLSIATDAVNIANGIVKGRTPGAVTSKGDRDMATEVDYAVEETVRTFLRSRTPMIDFLGEEEGGGNTDGAMKWVLDPVDGTANFLHGIPLCGISLALLNDDNPILGIIDLPFLGLRYSAVKGEGAYRNGSRVNVACTERLEDAIISIGDYAVGEEAEQKNMRRLALTGKLAGRVLRVRMFGSAATDLAWMADGRTSASIILSNKPWDMAAGVIIAREAGAQVFDWDGTPHNSQSSATIAVTPSLAKDLLGLLNGVYDDPS